LKLDCMMLTLPMRICVVIAQLIEGALTCGRAVSPVYGDNFHISNSRKALCLGKIFTGVA
jgi:hypothetical protein